MASSDGPTPDGQTEIERLHATSVQVHATFEALSRTAGSAPRLTGVAATRLRRPLGQLVATAQYRDMYDQRMDHVAIAMQRAPGLSPATRSAVRRVLSQQLGAVSALLEQAGGTLAEGFTTVADIAEDLDGEDAATLSDIAESGQEIADALFEVAGEVSALGRRQVGLVDDTLPAEELRAQDLGWMTALYTMEEERRIHSAALAGAEMPAA